MLKFCIYCLLAVYLIGATVSIFVFIIDTFRWHKREEHIKIVPSAQLGESEVIQNERRDFRRESGRGDNNVNNSGNEPDGNRDNNDSDNFF